jgi:hypothetical protein
MDFSVYKHLAKEQKKRYSEYRIAHPELSETDACRIFFSQLHEINLTKIINQSRLFQDSYLHLPLLSRRKQ